MVVLNRPDFADFVDLGLAQPRRYGAADPQVLARILRALLELSHRVTPGQRPTLREQLDRLRATVAAQDFDETERAGLSELGIAVERNLSGPR